MHNQNRIQIDPHKRIDQAGLVIKQLQNDLAFLARSAGILPLERLSFGYMAVGKSETKTEKPKTYYTVALYTVQKGTPWGDLVFKVYPDGSGKRDRASQDSEALQSDLMTNLLNLSKIDKAMLFTSGLCTLEDGYKTPWINRDELSPEIHKLPVKVSLNAHMRLGKPDKNGKRWPEYSLQWKQFIYHDYPMDILDLRIED